jgi:hypothetical protein
MERALPSEPIESDLSELGFDEGLRGVHTSRTMMLKELEAVMGALGALRLRRRAKPFLRFQYPVVRGIYVEARARATSCALPRLGSQGHNRDCLGGAGRRFNSEGEFLSEPSCRFLIQICRDDAAINDPQRRLILATIGPYHRRETDCPDQGADRLPCTRLRSSDWLSQGTSRPEPTRF